AAGWVRAHSAFAMAFSLAENYPAAAPHFDALLHGGNLADKQPWSYLGNDSTMFVAYRTHALKKKFRQ
ncbi:MAG: hypothetical protein J2P15_24140, partial [Micromonosporaceae bacterium]|nr:hypothetical protein [Micromonosporaceae bacterium]